MADDNKLISVTEALTDYQKAVNTYLEKKENIDRFFNNDKDVIQTIIATRLDIPVTKVKPTLFGVDIMFNEEED